MPIDQDTPAPNGAEAIQAAGQAVNDQVLESAHQILSAVPIAAEAAERVKSRSESTGWQIGRYTGLRIAKFQNWLYEANRAWRFTDGTLCVLWCVELPDARSPYASKPHLVRSTRTEYNAGRHQAPKPHTPSRSYRRGDAARSGQPDRQQTQGPRSEPDASSQAERVETNAAGVMTGPASPTRPESPLPTAIKWGYVAIAIFALAVVSLAVVSRDDGFNSSPTTTSEPTTLAPSPPPEPSPPRPEVSLTPQRSDEWAGGRIDDWVVLFTLSSDHEFSAWRSDDRRATFGVQCRDNKTDAWLETGTHTSIETGDVEIQGGSFGAGPEYGRHIHMIQIRFDGGEVFSEGWVDSTPTPAKVTYAQNAIPLIRRIADAELMIVGFVPQNSGSIRVSQRYFGAFRGFS